MAKTIVEYCIDSYDQQQAEEVYGTNDSIRQIFSDSINKIVRQDTELFDGFRERIGAKRSGEDDKAGVEDSRAPKEKKGVPKKGGKENTTEKIEKAIRDAANLSAEIRDIRDELEMLQAIATHQRRVQEELKNRRSADVGESFITSDIRDMIKAAGRIKSNVEMTITLEQSQIANKQANESVKQSQTANGQAEDSVQQGHTLMIFTAITAFFLPSSFLSSLFALDVESFRKAPYWIFLIISFVSLTLASPFLFYVLWMEKKGPSALQPPSEDASDSSKGGEKETNPAAVVAERGEEPRQNGARRLSAGRKGSADTSAV